MPHLIAGMSTTQITTSRVRRGVGSGMMSCKREREECDEVEVMSTLGSSSNDTSLPPCRRAEPLKPSEATPCRRPSPAAASPPLPWAPHHAAFMRCLDEDSRSQSVATAATEGLSEDSVFFLDISGTQRPDGACSRDGAPSAARAASGDVVAASAAANEADAAAWQQQLSEFFARLDQRPLRVAPQA